MIPPGRNLSSQEQCASRTLERKVTWDGHCSSHGADGPREKAESMPCPASFAKVSTSTVSAFYQGTDRRVRNELTIC